ncbi:MAG: cysteine hydrolase family protein [Miltoncostaeaceae bacterium]
MCVDAVLFDIDTQHDFCHPAGSMFVSGAGAPSFHSNLAALVAWARASGHPHVAAADMHVPDEPDFSPAPDMVRTYPSHCVAGSVGAERIEATRQREPVVFPLGLDNVVPGPMAAEFLLHKREADVFSNPATSRLLDHLDPRLVVVAGVATDYCVAAAVEGLLREHPRARVVVAADASAGVFEHQVAARHVRWRSQGVALMSTAAILAAGAGLAEGGPAEQEVQQASLVAAP